jgi:serine/threonine protein kinase
MYEVMALRRPFDGKNLVSLVTQITKAEYPPISDGLEYSMGLKDLAYSLLQVNPDTRPTLKRLLRSSLIMTAHQHVPQYCTDNAFYVNHFGKPSATSPQRERQPASQSRSATGSSAEAQLLAEMEAWAAKDKDDLLKTEMQRGLTHRSDFVDSQLLDGTQLREMSSSKKATGLRSQPTLELTQSAEDSTWNEYYDDDDFEDDEDEVVCEPSVIPLTQRSFRFS